MVTRLAVTFAEDTPNTLGLPPQWPVLVEEVTDDSVVIELPRREMSPLQYAQWREAFLPAYTAWEASLELASLKAKKGADLWQACHEYEYARFSGGIFAQILELKFAGIHKAVDIQHWLLALWGDYYVRKSQVYNAPDASILEAVSLDFTNHAEPPWTVEQMLQDAASLLGGKS